MMKTTPKQLTRIEFYRNVWDGTQYRLKLDENGKPSTTLIDPTTIVSMDDTPSTKMVFKHDANSWDKVGTKTEMYYVQTTIAQGRGINGVDFQGFWVTKKTYENILEKFVEIV